MHAKSLQPCPTLCNPTDGSPPGSSIPGILQARILEWVTISFSNACMHAVASVVSDSVQPHRWQPTRLPHPWDFLGKNTGVGCHFLLQYMKVKSESEVTQSCLTLRDPMDCSPPGSSVHGIFQTRVLEWGDIAFSAPFLQRHSKLYHVRIAIICFISAFPNVHFSFWVCYTYIYRLSQWLS